MYCTPYKGTKITNSAKSILSQFRCCHGSRTISTWNQSYKCLLSFWVRNSSVESKRHAKYPPSVTNETRVLFRVHSGVAPAPSSLLYMVPTPPLDRPATAGSHTWPWHRPHVTLTPAIRDLDTVPTWPWHRPHVTLTSPGWHRMGEGMHMIPHCTQCFFYEKRSKTPLESLISPMIVWLFLVFSMEWTHLLNLSFTKAN